MKRIYTLLVCILLLPKLIWAQNYIALYKGNTFHYGNSYLIDIPLKQARGNLLIKDPVGVIPLITYSKLLHEIDNLTYVNSYSLSSIFIIQPLKNKTPVKKRAAAHNYDFNEYIIKYYPEGEIDTLNGTDDNLAQYKPLFEGANELKRDSILIYYCEAYGSVCCPRDPIWDTKIILTDFISEFEKTHQIKIGALFSVERGKEGEHIVYLTLSGLTSQQKIQFIDERIKTLASNRKDLNQPTIYTPYWIPISSLKDR